MKKRIIAIILLVLSFLCVGCKKEFEYSYDKFCLKSVGTYGKICPRYTFIKRVYADMVFEDYAIANPNGYELYGETQNGHWEHLSVGPLNRLNDPEILACYVCYSEEGMGDTKLNIYFNYTVASTGERKEEVWEVDFSQEPYEDKR